MPKPCRTNENREKGITFSHSCNHLNNMYHLLKWASCYTAFFFLEFLHLKIRRANIKQERWFLHRHADEWRQKQSLSSVGRFLLLLYSGIYDTNNPGVEKPHIFTETSFNVITSKVWQKPRTIQTICTGFRLPVWYSGSYPTVAVLISLNCWRSSPQHARPWHPHSALVWAPLWQNSCRFSKKLGLS